VAQGARGAQKEGTGLAFHPHPSRLNFLDLENLQRTISLSPLPNLPRVSSLIPSPKTRRTRR
jgi:hypothetical protein